MKQNKYLLNTLLTAVLFAAMLTAFVLRAVQPSVVLPPLNIPNMALISLLALVPDAYLTRGTKRCWPWVAILSAAAFALLPLAAGFANGNSFWKIGLTGGAVFTVSTWLFDAIQQRLSSGEKATPAPLLTALGLYLAAQCFAGILL